MTPFVRSFSTTLVSLFTFVTVACSGGAEPGGAGGDGAGNTNTGAGDTGTGNAGTGNTGNTGTGNTGTTTGTETNTNTTTAPSGMDWTGTWIVDVNYEVACDFGFGNIKSASWTQTDTMVLHMTGSGGVTATFPSQVNYDMAGTGNDHLLVLTGVYPAKDDGGGAADSTQTMNTVTIKLDTIASADQASGSFSGQFAGQFGQDCTISGGTASFTR